MSIHFEASRWQTIRETYAQWWAGTLERPLVKVVVEGAYAPDREPPKAPLLCQATVNDFSYSAKELIDAIDYDLSQKEYLGDSFPIFNMDCFGPGVVSAFCGAKLDNDSGNVWFFPPEGKELELEDIHIVYDPNNKWVQRIKDLYREGLARWQGNVMLGMPDLGGTLDIVAVFRGTENLLMDLYDEPEEVLRLVKEADAAWFAAYQDFASVLYPADGVQNPGYSDWCGIYSAKSSYILQSDFSFNVSPGMFREFALPSLVAQVEALDHTIYHLDGANQLNHLDDLLALPKLAAIQWVFGDGMPPAPNWMDVYEKIEQAGKGSHINGNIEEFDYVASRIQHGTYGSFTITPEAYAAQKALYHKYI